MPYTLVCLPPPLSPSLAACLTAPGQVAQGAGEGSDFLRGELRNPIGFYVTCCDSYTCAFLASENVRRERRA